MKLEPKELMKEIVSGHVPPSLLNQVAGRLPAEMLQKAVDFLSKTKSDNATESECEHYWCCHHVNGIDVIGVMKTESRFGFIFF